jgi:hypothetical protein
MSDLSKVAADHTSVTPGGAESGPFEAQVAATFERLVADYVDRRGGTEPVSPAVAGAVLAAILPVLDSAAATPEFGHAVERSARERFTGPVCLLWEPLEEILNLLRPGHIWQFGPGAQSVLGVPAQLPRTADEPAPAGR